MNRITLIYNPAAGSRLGEKSIESVTETMKSFGFLVDAYPLFRWQEEVQSSRFHPATAAVVVAGGDGTLHAALNTLLRQEEHPPLAVLPWGTANDFAAQLAPGGFTLEELLVSIVERRVQQVDVGRVNDRFFLNVVGGGLLVDVAHRTSESWKYELGMLGYYLQGARSFPTYRPFTLRWQAENSGWHEEEVYIYLVLNGTGAGGFHQLLPSASISDGRLHLFLVKNCGGWTGLLPIFAKLLRAQHLEDSRVFHLPAQGLTVEGPPELENDVDGEPGPSFPLHFQVMPGRLQVITVDSERKGSDSSG